MPTYTGTVDLLASGSAYVIVEGLENDIFIPQRRTGHALAGDKVEVRLMRKRSRPDSPEGEITSILERSSKTYVGTAERMEHFIFVRCDSKRMPYDIYIPEDKMNGVENGFKVQVRVTSWPDDAKNPRGEILKVFGKVGHNDTEMHAILAEFDLPADFPAGIEQAAEAIPGEITDQEIAKRRDMRTVTTFTIDPADAKDFDDALSIRTLENGNTEVGVHIADVTHYVRENSEVESEAVQRATSIYLVDRTIPMLPERLSNFLCSLRPDEDKLAFSAVFELTNDGQVVNEWFGRTVIRSNKRFTYADAQRIIEGNDHPLKNEVLSLHNLAQKLRADRFRNGAISFEREEAKFKLDKDGKPLGVYFKEQQESNQLIEEFMLLANKQVATFLTQAKPKRPVVYRVHDKPAAEKLDRFKNFIANFGYRFTATKPRAISNDMNRLMAEIHGKAEENVISTLAIRTMAKAFYTTDNIGHYGLAFDYYTHFTSPIRRYPDMLTHRILAHTLKGDRSLDKPTLEGLCEHSTDMEIRASEAERASIKYKMVEFMTERIGQEFQGTVSGVAEWGIYVELTDTHIEGMVALRDIRGDYYESHKADCKVVGRTHHRTITLGDKVLIKVKRADLARRQLDFDLIATYDFGVEQPDYLPEAPATEPPRMYNSKPRRR